MKRKLRSYESPIRAEAAEQTRARILAAGRKLLVERGYAGMTMQAVADAAGVALDTVYASAGKKPALVELLIETAISNTTAAVPAEQRDYVQHIQATTGAREKLAIYARAAVAIQGRLAPLVHAIEVAGRSAPDFARLWKGIAERRARNMRLFANELLATGELRADLTANEVADVVWVTSSPQVFVMLLEQRGWKPAEIERWLADSWTRLFLG